MACLHSVCVTYEVQALWKTNCNSLIYQLCGSETGIPRYELRIFLASAILMTLKIICMTEKGI